MRWILLLVLVAGCASKPTRKQSVELIVKVYPEASSEVEARARWETIR